MAEDDLSDVVGGPEEMGFKLEQRSHQSLGWPEEGSCRGSGGDGKGSQNSQNWLSAHSDSGAWSS